MASESWTDMSLGEFVTLQRGHDLPEGQRVAGSVPILGSFGITGEHNVAKAKGPGVTVGRSGASFGVVSYSAVDYWPLNTALYVIDFHGNDERFAYYFLQQFDFKRYNSGSAQPSLNRNYIHPIRVRVPPLIEQRAIAQILGTLDDKMELNRRMNETLEIMARALFVSWLVDFNPVQAKAEGRDPNVPSALADLFPDSFEHSEVGEIPKGWEVSGLDETGRFLNGLALQKFPPQDGRFLPVIKIAQLRSEDTTGADKASADLAAEYVVEDGDVLFSWSGSLECVLWAGGRGALNQHLFKVTSEVYPKWFYFLWIRHYLDDFRGIAAGKATTMGHIQRHHLSAAKVVVPPTSLLKEMSHHFAPLIEQVVHLKVASKHLAAIRNALLPKLISGELRLPDAERILGVQA